MVGLIISLIVAGIAGWIAGNIMKANPFIIAGSPILGNIILGVIGGFVGRVVLLLLGLGTMNIIGSLVAAVIGAVIVIFVVGQLKKR